MKELKEVESQIAYLADPDTALWEDGKDDPVPLPEKVTTAQLRSALLSLRGDTSQIVRDLMAAVEAQQKQIAWMDRALKDHRHQLESGTFSAKPEF